MRCFSPSRRTWHSKWQVVANKRRMEKCGKNWSASNSLASLKTWYLESNQCKSGLDKIRYTAFFINLTWPRDRVWTSNTPLAHLIPRKYDQGSCRHNTADNIGPVANLKPMLKLECSPQSDIASTWSSSRKSLTLARTPYSSTPISSS